MKHERSIKRKERRRAWKKEREAFGLSPEDEEENMETESDPEAMDVEGLEDTPAATTIMRPVVQHVTLPPGAVTPSEPEENSRETQDRIDEDSKYLQFMVDLIRGNLKRMNPVSIVSFRQLLQESVKTKAASSCRSRIANAGTDH